MYVYVRKIHLNVINIILIIPSSMAQQRDLIVKRNTYQQNLLDLFGKVSVYYSQNDISHANHHTL